MSQSSTGPTRLALHWGSATVAEYVARMEALGFTRGQLAQLRGLAAFLWETAQSTTDAFPWPNPADVERWD